MEITYKNEEGKIEPEEDQITVTWMQIDECCEIQNKLIVIRNLESRFTLNLTCVNTKIFEIFIDEAFFNALLTNKYANEYLSSTQAKGTLLQKNAESYTAGSLVMLMKLENVLLPVMIQIKNSTNWNWSLLW